MSQSDNILFNPRVRSKSKHWIQFRPYYQNEKISLKERLYTLWYVLERTGYTTQGECKWEMRMRELMNDKVNELFLDFQKDYKELLLSIDNKGERPGK